MSDFGEGKTLKTRTKHRCEWCGEGIEAGTECFHYKGKFDGDWQDWYMHPECEEDYSVNRDTADDGYFMPYSAERRKKEMMA
jgi:hypothetical protein